MRIQVRVIPRSKKAIIKVMRSGELKIKLTAAPVKNRANEELCRLLADYFDVAKNRVKIIKGEHSRNKLVEILGK